MYSVQEQTKFVLLLPSTLTNFRKLWAHDVHAMKLPCAKLHIRFTLKDAMKGIQPKQRVKLCVDCHGKQQNVKLNKIN